MGFSVSFDSNAQEKKGVEIFQFKNDFFLLEGWSPIKKDLYVVSDPFCKFCILDVDKLEKLDTFNIFLIPSDIVSNDLVPNFLDDFYNCKFEKSKEMFQRKSIAPFFPECEVRSEQEKKELVHQSRHIIDFMKPNFVPFYYVGAETSIDKLLESDISFKKINGQQRIVVDWGRYDDFLQGKYQSDFDHVLLSNASSKVEELCEESKVNCYDLKFCKLENKKCQRRKLEWQLLFDYSSDEEAYYFEGDRVNEERMVHYLEFNK